MATEKAESAIQLAAPPFNLAIIPGRLKQPRWGWGGVRNLGDGTHLGRVEEWWRRNPNDDVILITGGPSGGVCVLDLDVHPERGIDGWEVLRDFELEHGEIAGLNTVSARTGSGGRHIYFRDPTGSLTGYANPETGVDLRANGQIAVVPPSDHASGARYIWETSPWAAPIEEAGEALLAFIEENRPRGSSARCLADEPHAPIPEGRRNDTLFRRACGLVRAGAPPDLVEVMVVGWNRVYCLPPLSDGEVEEIVRSAGKKRL